MHRYMHYVLGLTALLICGTPLAHADFNYEFVGLGAMHESPLAFSMGMAVNNHGQATGQASLPGLRQHAFLYENGSMQDLGDFGGGWIADSIGCAINNHGHIAGGVTNILPEAFLYRGPGDYEMLGTLGGLSSCATSVNDSGQVVGQSSTGLLAAKHAFLWQDGMMSDLGTLGGDSIASKINNAGQIVGCSDSEPGLLQTHLEAFIYENGQMRTLDGMSGESYATDISDTGVVVGHMWSGAGDSTAFCWTETQGLMPLPSPYRCHTEALAVNNSGDIVGVQVVSLLESRALLWKDGEVIDLTEMVADTGWTLLDAMDINDEGCIVGTGVDPNGQMRAYMLQIPEPSSLALLALGGLAIGRFSKRG